MIPDYADACEKFLDNNLYSDEQMSLHESDSNIPLELFALDDVSCNSSDDLDTGQDFDNLDDCLDAAQLDSKELFYYKGSVTRPAKRQKCVDNKPIVFVRFNTRQGGRPQPITIKALLDSGGSGSLVTEKHAKKLRVKTLNAATTVWTTPGGAMKTTSKVKSQFMIPELHDNRLIDWTFHVTKSLGSYDMIIGRDIMEELGIDLRFSDLTVNWDGHSCPFKDGDATLEDSYFVADPTSIADATDRLKGILDAKYEKADLEEIVKEAEYLSSDEQQKLLRLLQRYETLFDGTLGNWEKEKYDIELKPDACSLRILSGSVLRRATLPVYVSIDPYQRRQ